MCVVSALEWQRMDSAVEQRERWNEKYRTSPQSWMEPDIFLLWAFRKFIQPALPNAGHALDLAGGAGRQAIWLAQQGWQVTLIDISETGVELARQKAGALAPHIHFVVDDLTQFRAGQTRFDVVMGFYYLDRMVFPEIVRALRPGGLLLYKTYTIQQLSLPGGPKDVSHLLEAGELKRLVSGLELLWDRETVAEKATAEVVAKKSH